MKKTIATLGRLFLLPGIAASSAQAASSDSTTPPLLHGEMRHGPQNVPPPEAFAACKGKKDGERSQLIDHHGETLTGTCRSDGTRLVLRPDRPGENGGPGTHTPPPEAYAACEGKHAGDAAQLIDPRGETLSGTCEEIDGKLVLRPERPEGRSGDRPESGMP